MQEFLQLVQCCLPKKWRFCKQFRIISPNKKVKKGRKFINWVKFKLWEGEQYDKSEAINTVLHPPKVRQKNTDVKLYVCACMHV